MKSEVRRSEMARDAARSELKVVEQRNHDLQHELELERTEMRKLRQERRLLSAPVTYDPMQVEHASDRPPSGGRARALQGS